MTTIHYKDADALVTELMHLEGVVEPRYEYPLGDGTRCLGFMTGNPVRTALNLGRLLASENVDIDIAAAFIGDEVRFEKLPTGGWALFFPQITVRWDF